jgi:glycosyltransferase involved in cell wall biosynthesis
VSDHVMSVVICTHNRPADLRRCLDAVALLDDPVEVIVVDSASSPSCEDLVASYASRVLSLDYVYESQPGLSIARNRGIERSTCAIVAFIDDDAAPLPDWAGRLAGSFVDADVACAGGTCRAAFTTDRPRWLSDRLLQFSGITRIGDIARDVTASSDYPFGANIAFRRAGLCEVGGFPTNLGRVGRSLLSGEEFAVIEALRDAGWRVRLEPAAVVDHFVAPERTHGRYYWRRLWWQGISRARAARSGSVALRLVIAAPVRVILWAVTRDRFYLYRTAETVGYLREQLRRRPAA